MWVAVDVGYGFTKAVSGDGRKVSFPSAAAPAGADPLDGVFGDRAGHVVRVVGARGEEERLVGEAALLSPACQEFSARQEKPAALHDLLVLTAAGLLGASTSPGDRPALGVGLPLSFYRGQKDALKERLCRLQAWVAVDGGPERHVAFGNVEVFPQGAGALVSLGDALPSRGTVGLVDVGTYTTDFLLFEVRGGVPAPLPEACGSGEVGVHLIHRALAAEFEKKTGVPLPVRMRQAALEMALAGEPLVYRGREISLLAALDLARRDAAEAVAGCVLSAWGDRAGFVSLTALAGGGALVLGDLLKAHFSAPLVVPDPVFANARGYLAMMYGQGDS